MTAFGAADNDLSLSPGDPDLLGALGTFINMVVPGLGGAAPEISEKARDSGLQGQKLPVLTVTFGNISGEDPEIHIKEHCPAKQADGPDPQEKVDGYQDQQHHRQKAGELVHPVAPLHKAIKFFFHYKISPIKYAIDSLRISSSNFNELSIKKINKP